MLLNKKGLTLVEVMIALVVLLFVSLAMMQTALVSIDSNMKNLIRAEAVAMGEKIINDMRNLTYNSTTTDAALAATSWASVSPSPETRTVRTAAISFTKEKKIINHGTENKEVYVRITWSWKGQSSNAVFGTVLRRSQP